MTSIDGRGVECLWQGDGAKNGSTPPPKGVSVCGERGTKRENERENKTQCWWGNFTIFLLHFMPHGRGLYSTRSNQESTKIRMKGIYTYPPHNQTLTFHITHLTLPYTYTGNMIVRINVYVWFIVFFTCNCLFDSVFVLNVFTCVQACLFLYMCKHVCILC